MPKPSPCQGGSRCGLGVVGRRGGCCCSPTRKLVVEPNGLGRPARGGESPVGERHRQRWRWSRVPRGTRNPVGSGGDHPPRRYTPGDR